jgi:hypothetical protein
MHTHTYTHRRELSPLKHRGSATLSANVSMEAATTDNTTSNIHHERHKHAPIIGVVKNDIDGIDAARSHEINHYHREGRKQVATLAPVTPVKRNSANVVDGKNGVDGKVDGKNGVDGKVDGKNGVDGIAAARGSSHEDSSITTSPTKNGSAAQGPPLDPVLSSAHEHEPAQGSDVTPTELHAAIEDLQQQCNDENGDVDRVSGDQACGEPQEEALREGEEDDTLAELGSPIEQVTQGQLENGPGGRAGRLGKKKHRLQSISVEVHARDALSAEQWVQESVQFFKVCVCVCVCV